MPPQAPHYIVMKKYACLTCHARCLLESSSYKQTVLHLIFQQQLNSINKNYKVNQKYMLPLIISLVSCEGGLVKLSVEEMMQKCICILV